jgi:hypothetical protein
MKYKIESSETSQKDIESLSRRLGISNEEVVEKLLKIAISSDAVEKEMAADLMLEGRIDAETAENFLDESDIKNLEIARNQRYEQ